MPVSLPTLSVPPDRPAAACVLQLDPAALQSLRRLAHHAPAGFVGRVRDRYLQLLADQTPGLALALERADWAEAERVAHLLKASSMSLGAVEFGRLCADLEQSARCGDAARVADLGRLFMVRIPAVVHAVQALKDES